MVAYLFAFRVVDGGEKWSMVFSCAWDRRAITLESFIRSPCRRDMTSQETHCHHMSSKQYRRHHDGSVFADRCNRGGVRQSGAIHLLWPAQSQWPLNGSHHH